MWQKFRFRVSTALIVIALLLSPFALFNVRPIWLPESPSTPLYNTVVWIHLDLPVLLFVIAFFIALGTAVVLGVRRRWFGCCQCLAEAGICFAGFVYAPVY